jgi:hypothetical protein
VQELIVSPRRASPDETKPRAASAQARSHVDNKGSVVGFALGLLHQMQNYKDLDGYVAL